MTSAGGLIAAAGVCAVSAALEGLCAGRRVRAVFAALQAPRFSPPLSVWFAIGLLYYATFGFVLYRLFVHPGDRALVRGTVALVAAMMVLNASWNLIFFRARNLFAAWIMGSAAPIPDILLLLCLRRLDALAALALLPYLVYRAYAVWWGYAVWIANRDDRRASRRMAP